MLAIAKMTIKHAGAAAKLHRAAGALIPGYDTSLHTQEEFQQFYHDEVMQKDELWGAFDGETLRGFVAMLPGWVDHLYVDPARHRQGIGSQLIELAQQQQSELRLYTFQSNTIARRFYERHGFVIDDMTDGKRNEEKMPDITYHWVRPALD